VSGPLLWRFPPVGGDGGVGDATGSPQCTHTDRL